jgi:hypothetical protein
VYILAFCNEKVDWHLLREKIYNFCYYLSVYEIWPYKRGLPLVGVALQEGTTVLPFGDSDFIRGGILWNIVESGFKHHNPNPTPYI